MYFICFTAQWHLGRFQFGILMTKEARNCLVSWCTCPWSSLSTYSGGKVFGKQVGMCAFNFIRQDQAVFQSTCTELCSHSVSECSPCAICATVSSGRELCGFAIHFPRDWYGWTLFHLIGNVKITLWGIFLFPLLLDRLSMRCNFSATSWSLIKFFFKKVGVFSLAVNTGAGTHRRVPGFLIQL